MRPEGPGGLEALRGGIADGLEQREAGKRAIHPGHRGCVCHPRAKRGCHRQERRVEDHQRAPSVTPVTARSQCADWMAASSW